ncbi:MAG: AmmeMemoRadiSam system protein B [Planctomycetes bacterium]|nr:AmmeMemoRadiSam system protein B [Planctomycetota bacterium]
MSHASSAGIEMTLLFIAVMAMVSACSRVGPAEEVRECTGAGRWFAGDSRSLAAQVDGYLTKVKLERPAGKLLALVSPHAGYDYSGLCAAYGYSLLKEGEFSTVVLLGFSHYVGFRGASIADVKFYSTPLGRIPVDRDVCDKLLKEKLFTSNAMAHRREHSDENQLPFLQRTLKTFKLVPLVLGELEGEDYQTIADGLKKHIPSDALIVASSDFTHYGENFGYMPFRTDIKANLKKLDGGAIDQIVKLDAAGFLAYVEKTGATICGRRPIAVLLKLLPKDAKGHLLNYYTSGDLGGDYSHSVSYASIAFTRTASASAAGGLTEAERATLLKLARETLETYVKTKKTSDAESGAYELTPRLKQKSGAFVTLKIQDELRGCIGHIEAREPLYRAVLMNAVNSAVRDPRFSPVQERELKSIRVEISALSPLQQVKGPDEFIVGQHGILIEKGMASAVFLPQVAPEQGWNREETLQHLCRKAGLPLDAWKKDTTFYVFTAEVFHEVEP